MDKKVCTPDVLEEIETRLEYLCESIDSIAEQLIYSGDDVSLGCTLRIIGDYSAQTRRLINTVNAMTP